MEKKVRCRHKIEYAVIAVMMCTLLWIAGRMGQKGENTAQIVLFGDSVYGNVRDESAIPAQLEALTGMSIYNAAIGGTTMGRWDVGSNLDYSGDSLSVVALAKAVYASDFGVQKTMRPKEVVVDYFYETIRGLADIDFSSVELVIIGSGTNDYFNGIPLENSEDPMDEYTFAGALRRTIDYLRKANPELRILLVTPTYNWYLRTGQSCEEFDVGGVLEEYVDMEIRVADETGVELLDLYHDFYPHEQWEDWERYTTDGVHPNEDGRAMIAERIAEYLGND